MHWTKISYLYELPEPLFELWLWARHGSSTKPYIKFGILLSKVTYIYTTLYSVLSNRVISASNLKPSDTVTRHQPLAFTCSTLSQSLKWLQSGLFLMSEIERIQEKLWEHCINLFTLEANTYSTVIPTPLYQWIGRHLFWRFLQGISFLFDLPILIKSWKNCMNSVHITHKCCKAQKWRGS